MDILNKYSSKRKQVLQDLKRRKFSPSQIKNYVTCLSRKGGLMTPKQKLSYCKKEYATIPKPVKSRKTSKSKVRSKSKVSPKLKKLLEQRRRCSSIRPSGKRFTGKVSQILQKRRSACKKAVSVKIKQLKGGSTKRRSTKRRSTRKKYRKNSPIVRCLKRAVRICSKKKSGRKECMARLRKSCLRKRK
jgi:hypothetical protein